jgi:hypothetical protein
MKTNLDFENSDTKELLSKLDFKYFLNQNTEEENYSQEDMNDLYSSYFETLNSLKLRFKGNRKQSNYFLEGQVRKMFTGGLLPALFHLDEGGTSTIFAFKEMGSDLAYFRLWQLYYKRKVIKVLIWNLVIKIGSILAIILSIIKVWETFLKL